MAVSGVQAVRVRMIAKRSENWRSKTGAVEGHSAPTPATQAMLVPSQKRTLGQHGPSTDMCPGGRHRPGDWGVFESWPSAVTHNFKTSNSNHATETARRAASANAQAGLRHPICCMGSVSSDARGPWRARHRNRRTREPSRVDVCVTDGKRRAGNARRASPGRGRPGRPRRATAPRSSR